MKKLFAIFIILLVISGCGGGDDPDDRTAPIITNVVLTDIDGYTESTFRIGDTVNVAVYATDPDLDMETLFVTEYHSAWPSYHPYYGPDTILLSQPTTNTVYYFSVVVIGPVGNWRIEFQIDDYKGHSSNVFEVFCKTV